MNVVAALQSPTLLNRLASAESWSVKVVPMDPATYAEKDLLTTPVRSAGDPVPDVVLVCSPAQLQYAKRAWPLAKHLWVFHNGYHPSLPVEMKDDVHGGMAFSHRVAALQEASYRIPVHFISVAYEAKPTWSWRQDVFWTMRSRPADRIEDVAMVINYAMRGLPHTYYGQDQPAGFLRDEGRKALLARCTAYVSCLPRCAGFCLAGHEAFASGTPVLATPWGDMEEELKHYPAMTSRIEDLPSIARLLNASDAAGNRCSEAGLQYIRDYRSAEAMERSIERLGDRLYS